MTGEIKGYLLDYGGTLDTAGCHWGKFIWHGYERCHVGVAWDDFREAYVHTERALGQGGIILPTMTFRETLATKIGMQIGRLREREALSSDSDTQALEERLLLDLYGEVLRQMEANRPVLAQLADRAPLALVSNFYGNLPAVVEEMGIGSYFQTVVESAAEGIRKPDARLFEIALDRLGLQPQEVMVVGDSLKNDILPAHSLGCATAWPGRGMEQRPARAACRYPRDHVARPAAPARVNPSEERVGESSERPQKGES